MSVYDELRKGFGSAQGLREAWGVGQKEGAEIAEKAAGKMGETAGKTLSSAAKVTGKYILPTLKTGLRVGGLADVALGDRWQDKAMGAVSVAAPWLGLAGQAGIKGIDSLSRKGVDSYDAEAAKMFGPDVLPGSYVPKDSSVIQKSAAPTSPRLADAATQPGATEAAPTQAAKVDPSTLPTTLLRGHDVIPQDGRSFVGKMAPARNDAERMTRDTQFFNAVAASDARKQATLAQAADPLSQKTGNPHWDQAVAMNPRQFAQPFKVGDMDLTDVLQAKMDGARQKRINDAAGTLATTGKPTIDPLRFAEFGDRRSKEFMEGLQTKPIMNVDKDNRVSFVDDKVGTYKLRNAAKSIIGEGNLGAVPYMNQADQDRLQSDLTTLYGATQPFNEEAQKRNGTIGPDISRGFVRGKSSWKDDVWTKNGVGFGNWAKSLIDPRSGGDTTVAPIVDYDKQGNPITGQRMIEREYLNNDGGSDLSRLNAVNQSVDTAIAGLRKKARTINGG